MPVSGIRNSDLQTYRKHVTRGSDWGQVAGTDFWLPWNSGFSLTGTATAGTGVDELVDGGWTATALGTNTGGTGSDFMGGVFTPVGPVGPGLGFPSPAGTFADAGTPNHTLTDASGDLLGSPSIFGDAAHGRMAAQLAGKRDMPRYLIAEFWAAFTVASADETTSAIGFFEDNATISVEADQYAVVRSNGVNFLLQGNASTMVTGPLIATTWSLWKIVLQFNGATGPNVYAWRDGTIFSTTAGVGIQDEFPLRFGMHSLTTNRQGLGLTHVYYDW